LVSSSTKQRHAVGLGHDLFQHLRRQGLAARHTINHRHSLTPAKAVEPMRGDMGAAEPRRREFGAERYDQERPQVLQSFDQPAEHIE
jgi:hypothetical protein